MYNIKNIEAIPIEPTSFSELQMTEHDIEELIKNNTNLIAEDESMLIVGQQVRNSSNGICDLVGLNQNGDLVLIEIKRDRKDIETRKEAFEFQAIRYAAGFATIKDIDDLISKIYAPFLEKKNNNKNKYTLTITEQANRNVVSFFQENNIAIEDFNQRQQIILVASDFDAQTKSAVAWLNSNGVEMYCYKLIPYKIKDELYIESKKVLPLDRYEDYYVDLTNKTTTSKIKRKRQSNRRNLPRIDAMLDWGVVKEGDLLKAKNHDSTATLLGNGNVEVTGEERSIQQWLREVTGWSSVETYAFTVHMEKGKTLSEIRRDYMDKMEQ
ncbi:hypothetical protein HNQ94_000005 [Salirhabdus euzebyi]|uniref:RAMA domain-containing protein n=1 Tax=Salirhabdus euzebyi TaxID=394506 RepID=A0A841PV36_9BACI|nr:hypothetical protein [Salirhabdus euzebyi]MBB6451584.1 hypothetical protein [Salirhabdus euzebyi]